MNRFWSLLTRFVPSYRLQVAGVVTFSILSTVLSLFSFAMIVPILEILFGIASPVTELPAYTGFSHSFDYLKNCLYYYVTDYMTAQGQIPTLIWLCVVLLVLTFLKVITYYASSMCMASLQTGVVRDLRNSVLDNVVMLPIGFFTEERKGDIMSRISVDVTDVEASIMGSLDMLVKNPLIILVYLAVLVAVSWELSLFVLIMLPIAGLIMGGIGKNLKKDSMATAQESGTLNAQVEEMLGGLRIIKAFNAEDKISSRFHRQTDAIRNAFLRTVRRMYLAHPMSEFLGTAIIALVVCYGGYLILATDSGLQASVFIYYILIFYSIINPIKELARASYNVRKGLASLERIDKVMAVRNPLSANQPTAHITSFGHSIQYRDVSFKYKNDWILRHINLTVPHGKTIALVGASGSGKSTIVDLLPRFWDIQEGQILIDGIDIRQLPLKELRALMGNVNQEAILFNDSFFNNIAFGVKNATREQVEAAAKIANAHDFIVASEDGYDTNIGDRGCKLSGGQRQRISIARAILKNPPILILDEATSALDTQSERLVQNALERLMENRTTIVIAHRLSTVQNADEICVIDHGEIVERGTHKELIALHGLYDQLQKNQNLD